MSANCFVIVTSCETSYTVELRSLSITFWKLPTDHEFMGKILFRKMLRLETPADKIGPVGSKMVS